MDKTYKHDAQASGPQYTRLRVVLVFLVIGRFCISAIFLLPVNTASLS